MGYRRLSTRLILFPTVAMLVGLGFGLASTIVTNTELRESHISKSLSLSVETASSDIDHSLLVIENAVDNARLIAEKQFPTKEKVLDDANFEASLDLVAELYGLTAKNTKFVAGYWLIVEPTIRGAKPAGQPGEGVLYSRKSGEQKFTKRSVPNVYGYESYPEELQRSVAWWTKPKAAGKSLWTTPFWDFTTNDNLVTFSTPFFSDSDEFLGLVGLDLSFSEITDFLSTPITEYPNDKARSFLMEQDGTMIWNPVYQAEFFDADGHYNGGHRSWTDIDPNFKGQLKGGTQYSYTIEGVARRAALRALCNGFIYVLTVEADILNAPFIWPMWAPIIAYLASMIVITLITVFLVRHSLRPLHELRSAIQRVEEGDLTVKITKQSDDEIGELTESFAAMVEAVRAERSALNALAMTDGLTGVKNQAAHREKVGQLDAAILTGTARFAVVMCDVDNLKTINDTQGHINGDRAVRSACVSLCHVFKHSPVYRVGGDEFVAIAEGVDYENKEALVEELRAISGTDASGGFSFSVGLATFQPGIDGSFESVFKRADGIMYQEKRSKKK